MTICFKSNNRVYWKEKCNLKPNTIRRIDEKDDRFKHLREGSSRIRITNAETGDFFERTIKDVEEFFGWMVISWSEE